MKPITRYLSQNIWRDSSSEGEREYIVPRGSEATSIRSGGEAGKFGPCIVCCFHDRVIHKREIWKLKGHHIVHGVKNWAWEWLLYKCC